MWVVIWRWGVRDRDFRAYLSPENARGRWFLGDDRKERWLKQLTSQQHQDPLFDSLSLSSYAWFCWQTVTNITGREWHHDSWEYWEGESLLAVLSLYKDVPCSLSPNYSLQWLLACSKFLFFKKRKWQMKIQDIIREI